MKLKDEAATLAFGAGLAKALRVGDVVTLSGPLSAGKTTLVRGLLKALGHKGEVPGQASRSSSPTKASSRRSGTSIFTGSMTRRT